MKRRKIFGSYIGNLLYKVGGKVIAEIAKLMKL